MTHDTPRNSSLLALALALALALGALLAVAPLPVLAQESASGAASAGTEAPADADVSADADASGTPEDFAEAESPAEAVDKTTPRRRSGELVRIFSDLVVDEDEVIAGDAVCVGGDARVAGRVTGELIVVMGSLDLSGEVDGGAVVVMSDATYREGARVGRELVHVMGDLDDEGADLPDQGVRMELFGSLTTMVMWLASAELLIMLVIFVIFALAGSRRVAFMSEQSVSRYGMALLIGALMQIGLTIVNVTLIITVIGIPIAILLDLVFRVLRMYGRTALLHAIGAGLGRNFGRSLSVLGAVLLGFFALAIVTLVPLFFGIPGLLIAGLISILLWVVIDCPAVGVLALTKMGDASSAAPAAPPAAPPSGSAPPAPALPEDNTE